MTTLLPFIVAGIATGALYGLAATGLVLTYKTSGIFNFSHGAIAAASAYVFYWLHVSHQLSWELSMFLAVAVFGPVVGLVFELIGRHLTNQRTSLQIVGSVGVVLIVQGLATAKYGNDSLLLPQYLPKATVRFELGGVFITWAQVTVTAVSLVAVGALYVLFRFTRTGVAMRGVVDNAELTSLHGLNPNAIRRTAWIIGTTFAALTGVLIAPFVGIQAVTLTFLIAQAFGAAAIGRFSNVPLTYLGGILLGVGASLSTKYVVDYTWLGGLPSTLPFVVLIVVLLVMSKQRLTPPTSLNVVPTQWHGPLRLRLLGGAVWLLALISVPSWAGDRLPHFTLGLANAMLILSLGFLVRTSGIVSLAHAAFAAVGAVVFSQLITNFDAPWGIAVLGAALFCVPVAILLALPAVRLSGLFFALTTLGFGLMMEQLFYPTSFMFTTLAEGRAIPRPSFADSDRSYYFVVLAFLVLAAIIIVVVQQGRLGRLLRGMGDSTSAMSTLGLDLNVTRLLVFSISGVIAGVAGVLYGGQIHYAVLGDQNFGAFKSLVLVAIVMILPMREPWYAIVGGAATVIPAFWTDPQASNWLNVIFGVSAISVAVQGGVRDVLPERAHDWLQRVFSSKRGSAFEWGPKMPTFPTKARIAKNSAGLEVRGLTVRYGGLVAVDSVSLSAPVGRITGLIGPNGAGKTTLFNACTGLTTATSGQILLEGANVTRSTAARRARMGLGRTFQAIELCDSLSVVENVQLGYEAGIAGRNFRRQLIAGPSSIAKARDAAAIAMDRCKISHLAHRQAGSLTIGQRRLVELARTLAGSFDVLLLDEPSSGLDRTETAQFAGILREVLDQGNCGLLIVEHDMSLVLSLCSHIYVVDFGRLIFDGEPEAIRNSDIVRAAYLGDMDLDVTSDKSIA